VNILRRAHIVAGTIAIAMSACLHAQTGGSTPAPETGNEIAAASVTSASAAQSNKAADRALRKRVLTALARTKGLRATGITVRANNGAILLEGWVPEEAQIEQATRVAQRVAGVASVQNMLTLSTF
jgi:hyperosmotically inducible periplasmic protein